jgi:branched-chain amino acid aminotransferase
MSYCNVNGQCVAENDARIPVQDRGFRFGDGVFETIALHQGVPYQYDWHMERLAHGLRALKIPFDTALLQPHCRELVQRNGMRDGILRIQVTRGIGSQGYLPDPSHRLAGASFVIETQPAAPVSPIPVLLWQSSLRKISTSALPVQTKLCQGVNSTLARMEAVENKCFEALLLNERQQLCETSSGNLFWVTGGTVYTPSLSCGLLNGSTRASLMRLAQVTEAETTMEALMSAESVFITNVAWLALPVCGLNPAGKTWGNHETCHRLRQLLMMDRDAYSMSHRSEW